MSTQCITLSLVGSHYGGLSGKSATDFGRGSSSYVTFMEVMAGARLRGRSLETVRVERSERQNRVHRGDVLFNGSSETPEEVALSAVVDFEPTPDTYLNSFCFGFRIKRHDTLDATYLAYFFRSPAGRAIVASLAQGATRYNIAKTKLLEMPLVVPGVDRQREIAGALADADDAIAKLQLLIRKREGVRAGILQRLLARAPAADERVPLGSITAWLSGGTPNRSNVEYWSGNIPWISASTMKVIEVRTSDQFVTARAVKAGSRMAPRDATLLLVRGSALHSEIRACLAVAPLCFNQDVKALVPSRELIPKFLTYSIHGNASKLLRLVTSAGNTAGVLDTQVVKDFEIWLPDKETQAHIVGVLDDTYQELDELRMRLRKARDVRQGMLQSLIPHSEIAEAEQQTMPSGKVRK